MPEVGGNFVFASYDDVGDKKALIIGALLGVGGRQPIMDALHDAVDVLKKAKDSLRVMHIVKEDEVIGTVRFRPNHVLSLKSTQSIDCLAWPQKQIHINVKLKNMILPIRKGDVVGTLAMGGEKAKTVTIVAAESISKPTLIERLTRLY
jgi:hypothetical protein